MAPIQILIVERETNRPPRRSNRYPILHRLSSPKTEWIKLRRRSWAALIRLVYESDPLLCPKCRTQMKIVSVIKDGAVIDKILSHLQYKFEPLPLAPARPPPDTPPEWDFFSADGFLSASDTGSHALFLS